jgi:hypothetical protein
MPPPDKESPHRGRPLTLDHRFDESAGVGVLIAHGFRQLGAAPFPESPVAGGSAPRLQDGPAPHHGAG